MPATASATPSATPSATASATLSATRLAAASATPSAAASVVASPVPSASPQPTAYPPPPLPVAPPRGASTVLVVDDSKVVRIKTSRLLEKNHYRVLLADDGLTALQQVAQQWPDLVITDVEMPGLDGFGLTQRLREFAHGPALPVLMITSSDDKHRDAAARAGVTVLLGKPYAEERLLAEVEKALGRVAQPAPAGMALQ